MESDIQTTKEHTENIVVDDGVTDGIHEDYWGTIPHFVTNLW